MLLEERPPVPYSAAIAGARRTEVPMNEARAAAR